MIIEKVTYDPIMDECFYTVMARDLSVDEAFELLRIVDYPAYASTLSLDPTGGPCGENELCLKEYAKIINK